MTRLTCLLPLLAAAITAVGLVGCNDSTGGSPALSKPTPEESFDLIVETFKRGVEDIPIGFVVRREGGHSMMSGRNEVSHELITPAKEGDPYRGVITVDSEWKYSMQHSDEAEETDREGEPSRQESALDDGQDPDSIEILDSNLVSGSSPALEDSQSSSATGVKRVTREQDEKKRTYDLVYKNGRWALTTELDPETERSIENAFEKALNTQI